MPGVVIVVHQRGYYCAGERFEEGVQELGVGPEFEADKAAGELEGVTNYIDKEGYSYVNLAYLCTFVLHRNN